MTRGRIGIRLNAAAAVAAAVVLAGAVNYLGAKYYAQWDFTASGLHSLSERTERVLAGLDRDVRLISFIGSGNTPLTPDVLEQLESVLQTYRAANPARISVESVDLGRESLRAEAVLRELDIDPFRDSTDVIVVESGPRRRQVRLEELVEFDPSAGLGGPPPVRAISAEAALTSAVLAVSRERQPVVAFATGHGERSMRGPDPFDLGRFAEALEREDNEVVSWDARSGEPVPERVDVVVIASPTDPWQEREREHVSAFLERGGRVLLFLDPVPQRAGGGELAPSGLEPLLARRGIVARTDIVLDPAGSLRGSPAEFVNEVRGSHPIVTGLNGLGIIVSVARSIAIEGEDAEGTAEIVLESSEESWGETDLASLFRGASTADPSDARGPLPLIVAWRSGTTDADGTSETTPEADGETAGETADAGNAAREARLVVAGDVDLASNDAMTLPANRGLSLNLVAHLVDEERALGIPPKDRTLSRLFLTQDQLLWLFPVVTLLPPLLAILAAVSLWMRRRRD